MASRTECDRVEKLERDGRGRDAFVIAMALITRDDGDETGRIFKVIERAAEHHPDAALSAAMSYRIFARTETRPGTIATFFEMAIAGDDDKVRQMATFGFARHLLDTNEHSRGIRLMKMSRRLGNPEAAAELGRIYENGAFGVAVDLAEAVECYVDATEGESAQGMFFLAQYMLSNTVAVGEYHPLELIRDAAERGHPDAAALMAHIAEGFEDTASEPEKDLLPYVVVPDGCERIALVRTAMMNEFSVDEAEAGSVTAALHGYPDWETMSADAMSDTRPKGKFDEDCTAAEFNERELIQTEIFEKRTRSSRMAALTAIRLLRPTSRTATPSLRRFDRIMEGSIFKGLPPDLGTMVKEALEGMGMDTAEKTGEALRQIWPLKAGTWLDVFERHGWSMRRRKDDADGDGEQVAVSETLDGRLFKIYMSTVSYDPGDLGDEHVETLSNRIASETPRAVLIFNHPRISRIKGSDTRAAFFGGRILNNGSWTDFFLHRSDGIEDALRQHGNGVDIKSHSAITEHAFEGAIELAYTIAAEVTGQKDTEGFGLFHSTSPWSSPMPPAAMSAARLMQEIGSLLE